MYRENLEIKGLKYWFISSILGFFAFSSIFLKPIIGDYTAFLNNTLILTGFIFLNEGLIQFKNLSLFRNRRAIMVLMIVIAVIISYFNATNPTRRYLMYDI